MPSFDQWLRFQGEFEQNILPRIQNSGRPSTSEPERVESESIQAPVTLPQRTDESDDVMDYIQFVNDNHDDPVQTPLPTFEEWKERRQNNVANTTRILTMSQFPGRKHLALN